LGLIQDNQQSLSEGLLAKGMETEQAQALLYCDRAILLVIVATLVILLLFLIKAYIFPSCYRRESSN
jgi:hypothetical protein